MIIYGRNPLAEFIKSSPGMIEEIFYIGRTNNRELNNILELSKRNRIKTTDLTKSRIDKLCNTTKHQGIAARIRDFGYTDVKTIINRRDNKNDRSCIIILDHIEDPQNFGSILRTANYFNADGVIIPRDRAVPVTPAVIKVSAGAASTLPVARVSNLSIVVRELKDSGYWVVGTASNARTELSEIDIEGLDIALILGNEARGMSPNLTKYCDFIVKIEGSGNVESLNVSVAAGIMIYQIRAKK